MKNRFASGTKTPRDHFDASQEYNGTATSMTRKTAVHRICRLPRSAEEISSRTARSM